MLTQRLQACSWPAAVVLQTASQLCVRACTSEASDEDIKRMPPYEKVDWVQTMIVHKKGHDVLSDPIFNKGTAFSHTGIALPASDPYNCCLQQHQRFRVANMIKTPQVNFLIPFLQSGSVSASEDYCHPR